MVEARVLVEFRHFASIERSLEKIIFTVTNPREAPGGAKRG